VPQVADVLDDFDSFAEGGVTLAINVPGSLEWDDFIAILAETFMNGELWGWVMGFAFIFITLYLATRYDDAKAYVQFYPHWHEMISCHSRENAILRAFGANFVLVMTTNQWLYIFFVLPDLPSGRAQRIIATYNITIAQIVVLIMFFGMKQEGAAILGIPVAQVLAQVICAGITIAVKTICIKAFNSAFVKNADMSNLEKQIEKKEKLGASQQWHLVLRQTASGAGGGGDAGRLKAEAAWRGIEPLMNSNPNGDQFYDAKRLRNFDLYRDLNNGTVT